MDPYCSTSRRQAGPIALDARWTVPGDQPHGSSGSAYAVADLLQAYETEKTLLLQIEGSGRLISLEASIQLSLNSHTMQDNPEAPNLLSLLCLLPYGPDVSSLPRMLPSLKNTRGTSLALLGVAFLFNDKGRLRVLSPTRDFVLEHHPPDNACLTDMRSYSMHMAADVDKFGTEDFAQAVNLLSAEVGNISAVLLHFWKSAPNWDELEEFPLATMQVADFTYQTYYGDCMALLTEASKQLELVGSSGSKAECTWFMGEMLHMQGNIHQAIKKFNEANTYFEMREDQVGVARCAWSMGNLLDDLNEHDEAIAKVEEAKAAFASFNDYHSAARCTQSISEIYRLLSRCSEAVPLLLEAKAAIEVGGDRRGVASCMQDMAQVLLGLSKYEDALFELEAAKEIFE
ncbi:hypothetical protein CALCODRAFT_69212 [Calocera cornea HHB12733]|uniref:TPR-like protein n=1 Tax=Calocera cornea HHB12733 TaxID=1353952 RepID=A0A165DIN1_9BASI|nr:hypothetical protein CALCODRAFT_69212 [Calocera cornea HHB12733]